MAYITINKETGDELRLYYREQGSGQPIVFIHGWPLSSAMWEDAFLALSDQGYRCIAYDRRGYGQSDKPTDGYDYNTMAADLHAFMEALDLTNVNLVGFSMGGGEVARYLGKYGDRRVSRAVMVSAVPPLMLKTDNNPDGIEKKVFDGFKESMKEDRPAFLAEFNKTFFGNKASDEMTTYCTQVAMQASLKATLDCVTAFSETDFTNDLKKIKIPTLIIHGDADKTVPIDLSGKKMAEQIANAKMITYKGSPHGLFQTDKEDFHRDLLTFLKAGEAVKTKEATAN